MSLHGGEDAATEDEGAEVIPRVVDELLQVQHRPKLAQGGTGSPGEVAVGDAEEALAFGAEEGLDDDVAAELVVGEQGLVEGLTADRRRDRMPRGGEAGCAGELVDARLEGGRGVEDEL